uniref:WRKY19 n=1 Tax=Juglans sigillata TaxID=224355 RepID=A0A8F1T0A9_9ROSI|nr:WRKY19 [Juglans sigillata]
MELRILASYEKALMILRWIMSGAPGSLIYVDEFEKGGIKDHQETDNISKKRKILPRWTDHVRVRYETRLEGPHEDGNSWRKYGQKDILGAKYPVRHYIWVGLSD